MRSISSSKHLVGNFPPAYVVQNNYSPASDSTYYYFNGCGKETPSDLHLLIADRGDRGAFSFPDGMSGDELARAHPSYSPRHGPGIVTRVHVHRRTVLPPWRIEN